MGYYDTLPPAITQEETEEAIQNGDINKVIQGNLRLVLSIANQMQGDIPYDDLVQEGNLGLIEAANRYNPEKSRFSTYATIWIKSYMSKAIANESHFKITDYGQRQCKGIREAKTELQQVLRREPTTEEIKAKARVTTEAIERAERTSTSYDILEAEPGEEYDFREDVYKEVMIEQMYANLHLLTDDEREVIERRYGFLDKEYTYDEIAKVIGKSRTWVRKLESMALEKLRKAME